MDSSFLTYTHIALALFSVILFFKLLIQFGLSNQPAKFTSYVVSFCAAAFFVLKVATDLGWIAPWDWLKWRTLPMVAGSLALLLQIIMTIGSMSLIQQKVISRLPLIGGLLCLAFFPSQADTFFGITVLAACLFLTISVGRARYQKRILFKMSLCLLVFWILKWVNTYGAYAIGELFFFPALFYFSLFEQSFAITGLVEDFRSQGELL